MRRENLFLLLGCLFLLLVGVLFIMNIQAPGPGGTSFSSFSGASSGGFFPEARTKDTGCHMTGALPDGKCTPGDIFTDITAAEICVSGYAKSVRNVPQAVKEEVFKSYGVFSRKPGEYEVDHLVSLELGGANSIANLFPEPAEPRPGFHEKDQLENKLHALVCGGRMPLWEAQRRIATDWLASYQELVLR